MRSFLSVCFFEALIFPNLKKANSEITASIKKNRFSKNYLDLNLANNLRISRYNHTNVTINEKAPYHSIYFGKPDSEPSSIKSKSKTRLRAAILTTNKENPIPNSPFEWINPMPLPKKDITILTRYKRAIPAVAENIIKRKF
tara:strand:+ start:195 stop:620 length:426 start_codon:yes stop_codon:yes gene_type:complete